jgi:PAS domain S-box-containing protein
MTSDDSQTEVASRAGEGERRFRSIVDLSPDAIAIHDVGGKFVYVNGSFCATLGYGRDELLSMHPLDFAVSDSKGLVAALWREMEPGVPVLMEGLFRRKDGSIFPAEVRLVRFDDGGRDLIAAFCQDISSRKRAEEALRTEERNRIARDIHDTLAHGLTAIAVQLEAARQIIGAESDEVAAHVGNALRLAREGLREARRSVRALRPEALEEGDLGEALRQVVGRRSEGRPESFHFRLHGRPRPLPGETEAHLLRIGQEALTNAMKHARSANVQVVLGYTDFEVRLDIEDDGQGFDPEQPGGRGEGIGLIGMSERAERIGARLVLRSSPGGGMTVSVTVPAPPDRGGPTHGR